MGENINMLPGDMNLSIKSGIVGYNNKILVSDGMFSLVKNDKVNTFELAKRGEDKPKSYKAVVQPTITHKTLAQEKVAHSLEALPCGLCFNKQVITISGKISSTTAAI